MQPFCFPVAMYVCQSVTQNCFQTVCCCIFCPNNATIVFYLCSMFLALLPCNVPGGGVCGGIPRQPHGPVRDPEVDPGAEVFPGRRRLLHHLLAGLPQAGKAI